MQSSATRHGGEKFRAPLACKPSQIIDSEYSSSRAEQSGAAWSRMMEMEKRVGQLFMVGFKGSSVTRSSPILRDVTQSNLGGVILFDRFLAEKSLENNILSADQVTCLINDLQHAANGELLIAVDQEGGNVNRFKEERGFPLTLPAEGLGQKSDTTATIRAADQTAKLLSELGVNFNLAPVVDVNRYAGNPIIGKYKRSFSSDPSLVAAHAIAWIQSHHKYNIRCCLKHFPGHGSSRTDSHLGFVDVSSTWDKTELAPYRTLIAERIVDAVMTGHLYNSALDSTYPATLSKSTVDTLLRKELGYDGPVLSDDMQMQAITGRYGLEEAACTAIAAGVDMLIIGNNLSYDPDIVKKLSQAVINSLRSGTLTEERIEEALQRIALLKPPPLQL